MKIVTILVLFTIPLSLAYANWVLETVDTDGGCCTSLALDSLCYPHIAYFVNAGYDLKYAHWDGSTWLTEIVDSVGTVGLDNSLELDSNGYPHISYYDTSNNYLKYAKWDGSSWVIEILDVDGGKYTSLALDSLDNPCIAYFAGSGYNELRYASWNVFYWDITTVVNPASEIISDISLALNSLDQPCIAYSYLSDSLKYTFWNGMEWMAETVNTGYANDISLALLTSNVPRISYRGDPGANTLLFAYISGSTWHNDIIAPRGGYTSLELDSQQAPHISYRDGGSAQSLNYAYLGGSTWYYQLIGSYDQGFYTSLELDSSDNPRISYWKSNSDDLKYAWYNIAPPGFSLIYPTNGEVIYTYPLCDWEDAPDFPEVTYDIWYSTNPTFTPHDEINNLTESEYQFSEGELNFGTAYYWKVRASDGYEETWSSESWAFLISSTHIEETSELVLPYMSLLAVTPNPAHNNFSVQFTLPENSTVNFEIYDMSGRLIHNSPPDSFLAGTHQIEFRDYSSGIYFIRMCYGDIAITRRIIVL